MLHHSALFPLEPPIEPGARLAASAAFNVIEFDSATGFLSFGIIPFRVHEWAVPRPQNKLLSFMGIKNLTCSLSLPFWFPHITQQLNTSQPWFGIYHPFVSDDFSLRPIPL